MKRPLPFLLLLLGAVAPLRESEAAPERPINVLFLVADDLNSWLLGDTNRYAGKVVAPNIRRLADMIQNTRGASHSGPTTGRSLP